MDKLAYKSGSSKILRTAEKMPKKKKKLIVDGKPLGSRI